MSTLSSDTSDCTQAVDIAIVGAGISGLYAARKLLETNNLNKELKLTVIEARDRVGGRTLNERIGDQTSSSHVFSFLLSLVSAFVRVNDCSFSSSVSVCF
jgi:monoamine oxidase